MTRKQWIIWYIFIGAVVILALAIWGDVIAAWLGVLSILAGWGIPQ